MSQTGWTPVDESAAPKGWTPVAEPAKAATGAANVSQSAAQPNALQSAVGSVKNFFSGVPQTMRGETLGFAGGLGIPETMHPVSDLAKGMTSPYTTKAGLIQNMMSGPLSPDFGVSNAIESAGKGLYEAGKDMYQGYKQNDPERMGHGLGYLTGQAIQAGTAMKVPEGAARDYNAATLLGDSRPMGLANALTTRALARATQAADAIGNFFKKGEAVQANSVQDSVRSLQIADQMKSRAAGQKGSIDTTHAQAALDQALDTVGIQAGSASAKAIGLMEGMISPNATFEQAKQVRTVLGTLGRATKNPADRMVIGAARQQLTEAMGARAKDIGQTSQWKSYNDIWSNLEKAKDTWQQDLYDAAAPTTGSAYAMNRIIAGDHWGKIQQAAKELSSEFGVDSKEFYNNVDKLKQNVSWAPLDKNGMNFRGVLNTIGKHPITGLAAYGAAQALGLPFLARFLSVAAAGKLNDVLGQMGEPRASMPEVYGKLPEGGASSQQPPSVLTDPQHPIPPQHDYLHGAPSQTPEIAHAVDSIQQERAAAVATKKGLEVPGAATSGMPPKVGTAEPIERRVSGESYTGAERRSKLNPLPPPEGEELAQKIREARASIHQPEAGVLAKQIVAARQGSLGKPTPLVDPSPALAEEVKAAKQATFAAHQRAKGKR